MEHTRYQVNKKDIAYETFDNEVIVLNLSNGHYYSLENSAAELWQMLQQNLDVNSILSRLRSKYAGFTDDVEGVVNGFIQELLKEEILQIGADAVPVTDTKAAAISSFDAATFEVPILNKFTDLPFFLLT